MLDLLLLLCLHVDKEESRERFQSANLEVFLKSPLVSHLTSFLKGLLKLQKRGQEGYSCCAGGNLTMLVDLSIILIFSLRHSVERLILLK